MSIFKLLFKKSDLECPRCLGKGFVDWEDIQRLKKELKWVPAPCAYCNASGKTTKEMLSKVPVDTAFLTIDLPESEIEKIKNGDTKTLKKGRLKELFFDDLIKYTLHHHLNKNMDAQSITDLYLKNEDSNASFSLERENLLQYIEKVIRLSKSNPE